MSPAAHRRKSTRPNRPMKGKTESNAGEPDPDQCAMHRSEIRIPVGRARGPRQGPTEPSITFHGIPVRPIRDRPAAATTPRRVNQKEQAMQVLIHPEMKIMPSIPGPTGGNDEVKNSPEPLAGAGPANQSKVPKPSMPGFTHQPSNKVLKLQSITRAVSRTAWSRCRHKPMCRCQHCSGKWIGGKLRIANPGSSKQVSRSFAAASRRAHAVGPRTRCAPGWLSGNVPTPGSLSTTRSNKAHRIGELYSPNPQSDWSGFIFPGRDTGISCHGAAKQNSQRSWPHCLRN